MVFVTVGSQKFQFNRLLKKIDEMIVDGIIDEPVFAQIGDSDYIPQHYGYSKFLDRDSFEKKIKECRAVITHGGTGVIIYSIKNGKKVLALPRLKEYGEHVDDHQCQLLHQFDELGLIVACFEIDKFAECYKSLDDRVFNTYASNTQVIIDSIDTFLENMFM